MTVCTLGSKVAWWRTLLHPRGRETDLSSPVTLEGPYPRSVSFTCSSRCLGSSLGCLKRGRCDQGAPGSQAGAGGGGGSGGGGAAWGAVPGARGGGGGGAGGVMPWARQRRDAGNWEENSLSKQTATKPTPPSEASKL